ncbi:hypothetical protein F4604DRAFT_1982734 [Suillus subluteus]|nr:hypothetical protein F4604DRAFT_1982734 [Suillus subluteus]
MSESVSRSVRVFVIVDVWAFVVSIVVDRTEPEPLRAVLRYTTYYDEFGRELSLMNSSPVVTSTTGMLPDGPWLDLLGYKLTVEDFSWALIVMASSSTGIYRMICKTSSRALPDLYEASIAELQDGLLRKCIAIAIGLAAGSLGTETDGSIVDPSSRNNVVGIKPTIGLRCPTLRMCVISSFDLLTDADGAVVASHSQECPGHVLLSHVTCAVYLIYGSKANVVCDLETDEALMFLDIDAMPESEE